MALVLMAWERGIATAAIEIKEAAQRGVLGKAINSSTTKLKNQI